MRSRFLPPALDQQPMVSRRWFLALDLPQTGSLAPGLPQTGSLVLDLPQTGSLAPGLPQTGSPP